MLSDSGISPMSQQLLATALDINTIEGSERIPDQVCWCGGGGGGGGGDCGALQILTSCTNCGENIVNLYKPKSGKLSGLCFLFYP